MTPQSFIKTVLFCLTAAISASAIAAPEATMIIPISGDSGTTIAKANSILKGKGHDLLPSFIELSSSMSQKEIYELKGKLDQLMHLASEYEAIETKAAYGQKVEGKLACFMGDNKLVVRIYEAMVDTFLSEQFGILAVATKDPDHVGIKFDESDSGSAGAWINIRRCK